MNKLTPECIAIANYIIEKINNFNREKVLRQHIFLTTKRLQRLLYFYYIDYMIQNNGTLLFEDEFTVWPSGPAIERIYKKYMPLSDGPLKPKIDEHVTELTNDIKITIDNVLEKTQNLSTANLIEIVKIANGPWDQVYNNNDENYGKVISKEIIYEFYSKNEKKTKSLKLITKKQ